MVPNVPRQMWQNLDSLLQPISSADENLLIDNERDMRLSLIDIDRDGCVEHTKTTTAETATKLIARPQADVRVRILSIFSEDTIGPLLVTQPLLQKILTDNNVHPDFIDVLLSFGGAPHIAESCDSNISTSNPANAEHCHISYEMRYVEMNRRGDTNLWSLRHTGVFQDHRENYDFFLLLHSVRNPVLEEMLASFTVHQALALCDNPFDFHAHLFDCYIGNWKWYNRDLGMRFESLNDIAMVIKPSIAGASTTYRQVQELRHISDLVIQSRSCCMGNRDITTSLIEQETVLSNSHKMVHYQRKLLQNLDSLRALQSRLQNAIDLLGYTVELHNQMEAARLQNETAKVEAELCALTARLNRMYDKMMQIASRTEQIVQDSRNFAKDTVDESATVRVITIVSAIYLPGSFVGTLYGTNFFSFNMLSRRIMIASDFWIFLATWIPLTLLTWACYAMWIERSRWQKEGGSQAPWWKFWLWFLLSGHKPTRVRLSDYKV